MSDFGDWIDHQVKNVQNYVNTGLPTFGQVGDKINNTLGIKTGSLGDAINTNAEKFAQTTHDYYQGLGNMVKEGYNEISGSNYQRQQDWQNRVKADAEAQRLKEIADRNLAAQNADVSASNAAQASRTPRLGSSGGGMFWRDPSGPDITDYLGL